MKLNDIIDLKGDWAEKVRDKLAEATYVGIDFGTSTTTVTYLRYDDGTGTLIAEPLKVAQEDEQGVRTYDHLVPTVIAMLPGGHLIFGCGAKECPLGSQKFAEGMNVWSAFKMHLGEENPRTRREVCVLR